MKPDSERTSRTFFDDIRRILGEARRQAYAAANFAMVEAYWKIGRRIVEEELAGQQRAEYGLYLIRELSRQLGDEFGKGFSIANLANFKKFYLTFPDWEIGYALRNQLAWTHIRMIMRVENPAARAFYIREASEQNWSVRQLERSIKTLDFERRLSAPEKRDIVQAVPDRMVLHDFIKDPYVLEFLDLPESWDGHEGTLESAIIGRVQHFLLELGKGFSFVGRQFRISSETSHFYVDLVFYNYLLKCFVLIDLKTSKLTHQDIGQMDMYVRMFDDLKRGEGDNPTLGMILCSDRDDTIVHYSVMNDSRQLFASKYRLILPSEEELRDELDRRQIFRIDATP
jgi:predicted nuclease of restriction endonuclease-like (RecB) superfamily